MDALSCGVWRFDGSRGPPSQQRSEESACVRYWQRSDRCVVGKVVGETPHSRPQSVVTRATEECCVQSIDATCVTATPYTHRGDADDFSRKSRATVPCIECNEAISAFDFNARSRRMCIDLSASETPPS